MTFFISFGILIYRYANTINQNTGATMINLKLSKAEAKHLLEIFGYMQQNVFDGLWYDEQQTADQLIKNVSSQLKNDKT